MYPAGGLKAGRSIPVRLCHFRVAEMPIWTFLLHHETESALKNNAVWQILGGDHRAVRLDDKRRCGDGPHQRPAGMPYTLHPTPYTLHPAPYTLHPTPSSLHPTPCTLHPHPTPHTLHPTPCTLHPTPYTLHARRGTSTLPRHGSRRAEPSPSPSSVRTPKPSIFFFFFITLKPRVERYKSL